MLFNSLEFFIFFPIVVTLYFSLPHKYRWMLLLISSAVFYMAFIPSYILILLILIVIDYVAGIFIEKAGENGKRKKIFLAVSISATVLVLFFFKYFNFFSANVAAFAQLIGWNYSLGVLSLALPIGLSFHTFQSLSYVIEVYRGRQIAERHFGTYALYVMFFPQLVAGPIERPYNLLRQFYEKHDFDYARVTSGLKLIAWGLFKKVAVADRLAIFVNAIYNNPTDYQGFALIAATIFFAFQIYCDFSGYSDIAIGSARVMGFTLMKNFDIPYLSTSVAEFWRKWHISLSTWFRDYFYIPLGGNRVSVPKWFLIIFLTFLVSGLWHGAHWTFVIWGALHGFYVIGGIVKERVKKIIFGDMRFPAKLMKLRKGVEYLMTFSLVSFAWIFFRANSVRDGWYIVQNLFVGIGDYVAFAIKRLPEIVMPSGMTNYDFLTAGILITLIELIHIIMKDTGINDVLKRIWPLRWAMYYAVIVGILLFGVFDKSPFIYFQF